MVPKDPTSLSILKDDAGGITGKILFCNKPAVSEAEVLHALLQLHQRKNKCFLSMFICVGIVEDQTTTWVAACQQ